MKPARIPDQVRAAVRKVADDSIDDRSAIALLDLAQHLSDADAIRLRAMFRP